MLSLPSKEKRVFIESEDYSENVNTNNPFLRNKYYEYYIGYKESADVLVDSFYSGERTQLSKSSMVYPILFLYRQFLELYLKDIARNYASLDDEKYFKSHNLYSCLWTKLRISLERKYNIYNQEIDGIPLLEISDSAEKYIKEIDSRDFSSQAFRYPEDTKGVCIISGESISLMNLRDRIYELANYLALLEEHLCFEKDLEREYYNNMFNGY